MITRISAILLTLSFIFTGCATNRLAGGDLDHLELDRYLSRAKDPRMYWITVYESNNGHVFKGGNRTHPNQRILLDFDGRQSHLPIIHTENRRDKNYNTLIDTSCSETWTSLENAQAFDMHALGPEPFKSRTTHLAEPVIGYLSVTEKLKLDYLHLENVLVFARADAANLAPFKRYEKGPKPEFIIGAHLLRSFNHLILDFKGGSLYLSTDSPFNDEAVTAAGESPLHNLGGAIGFQMQINGKTTQVILDTGGDYAFIPAKKSNITRTVNLKLGKATWGEVPITPVQETTLIPSRYPRVGLRLFDDSQLILDFARNQLQLLSE